MYEKDSFTISIVDPKCFDIRIMLLNITHLMLMYLIIVH